MITSIATFDIYWPGAENPADYLSGHPVPFTETISHENMAEEYVSYVAATAIPQSQ